MRFFDEKNGIVCGDSSDAFPTGMFVTNDGGVKWMICQRSTLPVKPPALTKVEFALV